jgi:hypothetical protein
MAIAHIRRVALDPAGEQVHIDFASAFSEIAMWVSVRRDGIWWLAVDQKTPVHARPKPSG